MNLGHLLRRLRTPAMLVCVALIAVSGGSAIAAGSQSHAASVHRALGGDSGPAIHHDKSPPLRSIRPKHTPGKSHPAKPIPPGPAGLSHTSAPNTGGKAPLRLAPTAGTNFDGLTDSSPNTCGCAPPDNDVAAGPTQVVELVNSELGVYSKTGGTLISAESTNTLWSGFGGGCQTNNDGDGTVTYDTAAQRWVIQQFSVSTTPYLDCVAISTSSDATGTYNRYSFQYSNFPDYPKLGVWSDGYYLSFNQFQGNTFLGPEMCALDRSAMLTGAAASQKCFTPSSYLGSVLPATIDGSTPPPSGESEWYVGIDPNNVNALAYWKFHVDFSGSGSTLIGPTSLPVNAFSELCGGDGTCVPQSGTTQQLDSLGDRLMWRLAYRNFGDHEAMVVSHSIVSGTSGATRWYELRPSGGSLSVFQQGTFAPTSTYRWMGSIAMDHMGDMGLGYSTSSSSLHPGVAYTGRVPTDGAGTMETETSMFTGPGSQFGSRLQCNSACNRWGDYSEMSVDPADDCTFWYVNEYLPANGAFNWHTRVGSFKFSGCSASGIAPTVTTGSSSNVGTTTATIAGTVNPNGQSTTYQFDYGTDTNYGSHAPASPASAGSGTTAQPESVNLTGLTPGQTYHYRIEATNTTGTTFGSDQTFTTNASGPTLSASPSSVSAGGTVTVSWTGVPNPTSTDWIGVYVPGSANTANGGPGQDWIYDNSCTQTAGSNSLSSGSCSFTMPNTSGTYELRLLSNNGYTLIAKSNQITVTGGTSVSLTASPSSVSAGGTVTVSWTGVPNPTSTDWIGVYVPGSANTANGGPGQDWIYDNSCTQTAGSNSLSSGSCSFTMPNTSGTYELRLLSNNGYTVIATSSQVTVG